MCLKNSLIAFAVTPLLFQLNLASAFSLENSPSFIASAVETFTVGDRVEIQRNNQWRVGEILAIQSQGEQPTYSVRYLDVGFTESNVRSDRLRKKTASRPTTRRIFEVGLPVVVAEGDTYREGVVTGYQIGGYGGDRYEISYDDNSTETNVKRHQLLTLAEAQALGMKTRNYDLSSEAAIAEMVDVHNEWRAKVGVTPLTWSDELAEHSRVWAEKLLPERAMYHRPVSQNPYGENLARATKRHMTPSFVVNLWGSEVKDYDYESNQCMGLMCGHYTQMVWHETTQLGCAMARENDFEIWVCSYDPPGNYAGERPYPISETAAVENTLK